jgi:hypothetical protein
MTTKTEPREGKSRENRSRRGRRLRDVAVEGWEQGVPAPNGRIAKRWWQRLLGQASRRGLNADAVRDLINEWPLARADPIPADLHELEEVLVA